jgi:alpha-tubulin suppressor-like RCC1 family protein
MKTVQTVGIGTKVKPTGTQKGKLAAILWLATSLVSAQSLMADPVPGMVIWWSDQGLPTNLKPPTDLTNITLVTPNMALKADGTLIAWGNNSFGQCNIPSGLTKVVAIAEGYAHRLALKNNGTVVAWGAGTNNSGDSWTYSYGQSMVPAGLTNVVAIAAGWRHSLALRADGSLIGWGFNYYGQTNIPSGLSNVVAIAVGLEADFNLALRADGTVVAWGYNYMGETNVPVGLTNVIAISAGDDHSLALRSDGTVVAWGSNGYGQTNVPSGLTNVTAVASGWAHSLALKADGTVIAWGCNLYGQTNVPWGLTNVTSIAAGDTQSLAIYDGSPVLLSLPQDWFTYSMTYGISGFSVIATGTPLLTYQWQLNGTNISGATNQSVYFDGLNTTDSGTYQVVVRNSYGRLTSPGATLIVSNSPPIVQAPESQVVASGWDVTFWASVGGSLPCYYQWQLNGTNIPGAVFSDLVLTNVQMTDAGDYSFAVSNSFGTVASSNAILTVVPSPILVLGDNRQHQKYVVPGLSNVLAIAAGAYHCLALKDDGTVAAWGDNSYGQTNMPVGLSNVLFIAAGRTHSLSLNSNGTVVAWGDNWAGQTSVPSGLSNVVAVAGGSSFSLALKSNGTVIAWGAYSQATNIPPGLTGVVAIAAGSYHGLALRSDGTVVGWGDGYGYPTVPSGLSNVVAVAAGYSHSLALKSDGTVVAWGVSYQGYGSSVVPPGDLSNVVAIAAGGEYLGDHSIALKRDGTVIAWGYNQYGQTNVPSGLTNVLALAAGGYDSLILQGTYPPALQVPLSNPCWSNGYFTVLLPTHSGKVYALEYKNSLTDNSWTAVPLAAGNGVSLMLANPTATNSQQFYRVRQW